MGERRPGFLVELETWRWTGVNVPFIQPFTGFENLLMGFVVKLTAFFVTIFIVMMGRYTTDHSVCKVKGFVLLPVN
jgi:hypothetical protein